MSPVWIYATCLFLGGMALCLLGVLGLRRRRSRIIIFFSMLAFSGAIYAIGYGFEITRVSPYWIRFWSRFEYTGLPFIGSFLLLFVLEFVHIDGKLSRITALPPLLISGAAMVLRQTSHIHGLYYGNLYYNEYDGLTIMTFDKGPFYWAFGAYNVFCILASAYLIMRFIRGGRHGSRAQWLFLLAGILAPIIPYILYISGVVPMGIDITPGFLILSSIAFYFAVFRHELFALIPIGRDQLVETMPEGVFVLDRSDRIVDINPAARTAFGVEGENPLGREYRDAFPCLEKHPRSGGVVDVKGKVWEMSTSDLLGPRGSMEGLLVVAHDITDKTLILRELEQLARHDTLTGLLNRHSWDDAVRVELSRLARHRREGSVIYLDLDHFKSVNDTYGHAAGDDVLQVLSRVLLKGVRRPDLVGRYGGEEFVLFLPESSMGEAVEVAERLRLTIFQAIEDHNGIDIPVSGSFGVAGGLINESVTLEHMVTLADEAMYESKKKGRNQVSVADLVEISV